MPDLEHGEGPSILRLLPPHTLPIVKVLVDRWGTSIIDRSRQTSPASQGDRGERSSFRYLLIMPDCLIFSFALPQTGDNVAAVPAFGLVGMNNRKDKRGG